MLAHNPDVDAVTSSVTTAIGVLARHILGGNPSDSDGMAAMILFHIYRVRFSKPFPQLPGVIGFEALTRRHAAQVVADAWPDRPDPIRTDPAYWHDLFMDRNQFEVFEEITPEWRPRVELVRDRLLSHPYVNSVEVED